MDGFVDHEDIGFAGFGFFDGDGVTGLFAKQVFDFEAQQIACAYAVVDAEGEEQEVSRFCGEELFDACDVVGVSDGFDGDFRAFGRVVRVGHGKAPSWLSFYMISVSYLTFAGNCPVWKITPRFFH